MCRVPFKTYSLNFDLNNLSFLTILFRKTNIKYTPNFAIEF